MTNFVKVTGLRRASPAVYDAQWNGRPLRIALDTAATLRLMGNSDMEHKADILSNKSEVVAAVAQQLIDMRLEKPNDDHATIMISALDLDSSSSSTAITG